MRESTLSSMQERTVGINDASFIFRRSRRVWYLRIGKSFVLFGVRLMTFRRHIEDMPPGTNTRSRENHSCIEVIHAQT